jgi:hypothetical protein
MTTSSVHRGKAVEPVFTVDTDMGFPVLLVAHETGSEVHWSQIWAFERGKTLLDAPFSLFRPEELEHVTEVHLTASSLGQTLRRYDRTEFEELLEWLNERGCHWSIRGGEPRKGIGTVGDKLPFRFSFADLVTATEFKLRWG